MSSPGQTSTDTTSATSLSSTDWQRGLTILQCLIFIAALLHTTSERNSKYLQTHDATCVCVWNVNRTHGKEFIIFHDIVMEYRSNDTWEEVVQEQNEQSEEERSQTSKQG